MTDKANYLNTKQTEPKKYITEKDIQKNECLLTINGQYILNKEKGEAIFKDLGESRKARGMSAIIREVKNYVPN